MHIAYEIWYGSGRTRHPLDLTKLTILQTAANIMEKIIFQHQ